MLLARPCNITRYLLLVTYYLLLITCYLLPAGIVRSVVAPAAETEASPAPFAAMQAAGHEELVFWRDRVTGLRAIIAIHDTTLGPGLGGTRMLPYRTEAEAIEDALRLSAAMTLKSAAAGLDVGGGKAVIIGDSARDKSEALFRAYGRFLESLGG